MFNWIVAIMTFLLAANVGLAGDDIHSYLKKTTDWYAGEEAKSVAENVLSWQSDLGGWPKNVDTTAKPYSGDNRTKDLAPTFDNRATTDELRLLARVFNATQNSAYRDAFLKGYDYILGAQYPNGGWPQCYPASKTFRRYITFNDDAMVRLMRFLRETATSPVYGFLDESRKQSAIKAFDTGIQCILQCQIKVDGRLTAWCAQHDEKDFAPRPARPYELASLSGDESVAIVRLLMSLDNPSPEVIAAIQGAVDWFQTAAIHGIRVTTTVDVNTPKGKDIQVVEDASAPPVWARCYEIGTNQPIFCDRDGVVKRHLSEIGYERRNGYGWLEDWPQRLLDKEYPAWQRKWLAMSDAKSGARSDGEVDVKRKIVLVGDSTVAEGSGWGPGFAKLLRPEVQCVNWARGGRSSKSFVTEGLWKKALAEKPDYVLIQFGHNDQPGKGPERETDPKTTFPEQMGKYVDEARAIGAKPILITSLTRRRFGPDGKIQSSLEPYAEAVRRLAAEKQVPLVDLHARSIEMHNQLGPKESEKFDPPPKPDAKEQSADKTHLSHAGAKMVARIVADELLKVAPDLVTCFAVPSGTPVSPGK